VLEGEEWRERAKAIVASKEKNLLDLLAKSGIVICRNSLNPYAIWVIFASQNGGVIASGRGRVSHPL
jgi:hypothetical protein